MVVWPEILVWLQQQPSLTRGSRCIMHGCYSDYATHMLHYITIDKMLSYRRETAAGCVIVFAKSRRLELGDNILRTL